MKAQDAKIIQAIESGKDEKAIQALYDSSFRKIKDFVKKNSGRQEDAEDIFQDAVVSFYKIVKAGKFDLKFDIDAFLFTAARNLWINKAKRDQRIMALPDNFNVEGEHCPEQDLVAKERSDKISELFDQVGARCKELLTLVIYFDYSMKELCEKMHFPNENAAKTQHYKCKQKLIELIGDNRAFKLMLQNAE